VTRFWGLFLTILLTGCASVPVHLAPQHMNSFRASKVAVAFHLSKKQIVYQKLQFKGFSNEIHTKQAVFGDAWGIDQEMTNILVQELRSAGVQTVELRKVSAAHPNYADFYREYKKPIKGFAGQHFNFASALRAKRVKEQIQNTELLPREERAKLLDNGVKYFVLVWTSEFHVNTNYLGGPATTLFGIIAIYDVENNDVVFDKQFGMLKVMTVKDTPREIEDNNLSQFRAFFPNDFRRVVKEEIVTAVNKK
jgi:uncharacterized lipoprotein YmbA